MEESLADAVKNWRNLSICKPKPALHNINARTKFGENSLKSTKIYSSYCPETKTRTDVRQTDAWACGWADEQTDNQAMHIWVHEDEGLI